MVTGHIEIATYPDAIWSQRVAQLAAATSVRQNASQLSPGVLMIVDGDG